MRFLFVSSLGLNIVLLSTQEPTQEIDSVGTQQAALSIPSREIPQQRHENNIKFIEDDLKPSQQKPENLEEKVEALEEQERSEPVDYQEAYQQVNKKYNQETRAFIERDLGLSPETADFYFSLSQRRQKEIDDFVGPKIDPANSGDEPYLFTIEDNIEMAKINAKYINLLKASMGEANYTQYKKFRQNLNRKLLEDGRGYFWVEF